MPRQGQAKRQDKTRRGKEKRQYLQGKDKIHDKVGNSKTTRKGMARQKDKTRQGKVGQSKKPSKARQRQDRIRRGKEKDNK